MTTILLAPEQLDSVIAEFREQFRNLSDDERFVCWFLRAFISDSATAAAESLIGGSGDRGVDAIFVDEDAKVCFIIQGKYRQRGRGKAESRSDIIAFASLAAELFEDDAHWAVWRKGVRSDVAAKLGQARDRVMRRGFEAHFYYVTTGSVSSANRSTAVQTARSRNAAIFFQLFDETRVLRLLHDYLDGVAPPIPSIDLPVQDGTVLKRFDPRTEIDSWIFSMTDTDIASLYKRTGIRLFARNIRGFLGGNTVVNRGIEQTLDSEPERFWYYNNGITVICDDAKHETERARSVLRVSNPQIINGQQTTRTLATSAGSTARASVLVRVIRVPREGGDTDVKKFESLVSKIVAATNSQNSVRPSDLMSNDRRQIELERQLRNRGYWYIRKRQTKGEVRRAGAGRNYILIKKEELAQAVAACDLDPSILREGVDRLFEEKSYARIFPNADARFFLIRYWVVRHTKYAVRRGPERSYAKWLVANYVWRRLSQHLRSAAASHTFVEISEGLDNRLNGLDDAIEAAFKSAARFHRWARDNDNAGDWSAFSQRRSLPDQFDQFWKSKLNKSRMRFQRGFDRFVRELDGD